MASAVVTCDLEDRIIGWSETAEFGYAASELWGVPVEHLLPELARGVHAAKARQLAASVPATWIRKDGTRLPVLLSIQPAGDAEGNPVACCYVMLTREATERADALASLPAEHYLKRELYQEVRRRPEIFDFLQDGSLDGIWYWDLDHPEQEWMSPRLKQTFGYTDEEVPNVADWWQRHIFAEDLSVALENFRRHCADASHPYDQVVRYHHKNGSTIWVRCRGLAIRDAAGRPRRLLGAHTDVTAIVEADRRNAQLHTELESERRLHEFMEFLPQLIWTCEPNGTCDFLSQRWLDYTGVPLDLQLGAGWLAQVHPDDRERLEAAWQRSVQTGAEFAIEFRIRRHDGLYRWFDTRAQALRDERGRILKWCGSNTDIHEAFSARQALRESEERLRQWADAFEHCAHGIFMGDPDQDTIRVCNPALARMFGQSVEQVAGMPVVGLYVPAERDKVVACRQLADARGHAHFESVLQRSGEPSLPVDVDVVSVRDAERRLLYRITTVQDISERKGAEAQLRMLRSHLESAVEAASLGVWVWDLESNTMWGNDMQWRLWGLKPSLEPLLPQHVGRLIHEEDRERALEDLKRCASECRHVSNEFRIRRESDGQLRWLAGRASPELNEGGRPVRVVGVSLDITEQKLASEALLRSQKVEALGTLAGGIAHDFNNVLQAVLGHAELGQLQLPEEHATRVHLAEIVTAATRAEALVRQILSFSRPQEFKQRPVEVQPVVDEALQLLRATIPSSVTIEATVAGPLPRVSADPTQLHQVLVNLVTNAAHAIGRAPGHVEIRVRALELDPRSDAQLHELPPGTYVELSVRDDGCGMDKQTLARIFDPFFTTKAPGRGSGLGLSVVHGIMRGLGGAVLVTSEPGHGSLFRLYLPVSGGELAREGDALPLVQGRGQRLLFVDDERVLVSLGRETLQRLGYVVDAFEDPALALTTFREHARAYAAVITDLAMPGMTGFELAASLLAERPDLPVILMSGYIGPDERARAERIGIRALLGKPMTMDSLGAHLAAVLRADDVAAHGRAPATPE